MSKAKIAPTMEPNDLAAEQAALGAVLLNPDVFDELAFLEPGDFYHQPNGWIFSAMRALQAEGAHIDYLPVVRKLETTGKLAEAGGAGYVTSLLTKCANSLNAETDGRTVLQMATRRRMLAAASEITRLAHSGDTDTETAIAKAQSIVDGIAEHRAASISTVKSSADLVDDDIAEVTAWAADPQEVRGMRSGIVGLDIGMGGFEEGREYIVAGPPGVGKSALLGQMSEGFAMQDYPILYFALEMPAKEVRRRIVCGRAQVDSIKLKQGKLSKDELERYIAASKEVGQLPLYFEDRGGLSVAAMKATAGRYAREKGIKGVVIDTLQKVADIRKGGGLYEGTTNASVEIANWIRNSPYFGLVAGQLSRASAQRGDKRPALTDLRDSGSQEQDADGVVMIFREAYYEPEKAKARNRENVAELIIRKNRYGEANFPVEMYWQPAWSKFLPLHKESIDLNATLNQAASPRNSLEAGRLRVLKQEQAGKLPSGGDLVEPMPLIPDKKSA